MLHKTADFKEKFLYRLYMEKTSISGLSHLLVGKISTPIIKYQNLS
jgi:hypothetical protein